MGDLAGRHGFNCPFVRLARPPTSWWGPIVSVSTLACMAPILLHSTDVSLASHVPKGPFYSSSRTAPSPNLLGAPKGPSLLTVRHRRHAGVTLEWSWWPAWHQCCSVCPLRRRALFEVRQGRRRQYQKNVRLGFSPAVLGLALPLRRRALSTGFNCQRRRTVGM